MRSLSEVAETASDTFRCQPTSVLQVTIIPGGQMTAIWWTRQTGQVGRTVLRQSLQKQGQDSYLNLASWKAELEALSICAPMIEGPSGGTPVTLNHTCQNQRTYYWGLCLYEIPKLACFSPTNMVTCTPRVVTEDLEVFREKQPVGRRALLRQWRSPK